MRTSPRERKSPWSSSSPICSRRSVSCRHDASSSRQWFASFRKSTSIRTGPRSAPPRFRAKISSRRDGNYGSAAWKNRCRESRALSPKPLSALSVRGGAWIGRVWSREHGRAGLDLIHLNPRLDLQNPKKLVECTLFLDYRLIEYVILDLISRCTKDILGEEQPSNAHKVETNLPSTESTLDHKARRVAERNCQPPANDTSPSHKRRSCNHDGIRC